MGDGGDEEKRNRGRANAPHECRIDEEEYAYQVVSQPVVGAVISTRDSRRQDDEKRVAKISRASEHVYSMRPVRITVEYIVGIELRSEQDMAVKEAERRLEYRVQHAVDHLISDVDR